MTSIDRLSALLERFRVRTRLFHTGPLCGVTTFPAEPGRGFLHVLRRGGMTVTDPDDGRRTLRINEPSLLFYPRPVEHAFRHAPAEESDFACATLEFDGGTTHPLVRALPSVIVLPLDAVGALGPSLDLLFAEIDNVRCGRRVLADRLFEVVLIQLFRWMLDHGEQVGLPAGLLTGLSDERLARALVAMHEEPAAAWTLERMAREAAMSRSAFAERFTRAVGQSPADYLTDWRLTLAQERLRGGDSVSATAADLGYSSASAFSRAFARKLGVSPRQWLAAQAGEPLRPTSPARASSR